jgi:homoserine acetyltransferase
MAYHVYVSVSGEGRIARYRMDAGTGALDPRSGNGDVLHFHAFQIVTTLVLGNCLRRKRQRESPDKHTRAHQEFPDFKNTHLIESPN